MRRRRKDGEEEEGGGGRGERKRSFPRGPMGRTSAITRLDGPKWDASRLKRFPGPNGTHPV